MYYYKITCICYTTRHIHSHYYIIERKYSQEDVYDTYILAMEDTHVST